MSDMGDNTDVGISYVHIDGEYHIIVKLQKTGTVIEDFDWGEQNCNDVWGYTIRGDGY